jgi:hypothetical protein
LVKIATGGGLEALPDRTTAEKDVILSQEVCQDTRGLNLIDIRKGGRADTIDWADWTFFHTFLVGRGAYLRCWNGWFFFSKFVRKRGGLRVAKPTQ